MYFFLNILFDKMGGDWALEIESFLGPVKWHRADRQVPFGPKKLEISLSALTKYARNARSFSNIGPMKIFFQKIVIMHNNKKV
jgi:hypothetical protein